jgi:hypothetical protein
MSIAAGPGVNNVLTGVTALSATDAWAVGYYVKGAYRTLILHWAGTAWTKVPNPNASARE